MAYRFRFAAPVAAVFFLPSLFGATTYSVSILPAPAGYSIISMSGINNAGQVGGYEENVTPSVATQAFVSTPSGSAAVPYANGWSLAVQFGINASGQIVGYAYNGTNDFAFIGTTSTFTPIDVPASTLSLTGNAINDAGQVTGYQGLTSTYQGFVGTTSTSKAVPLISGTPDMGGSGINATGEVTGSYCVGGTDKFCSGGTFRAFIYNGTTSVAIPSLAGATDTQGLAINASGDVVGNSSGTSSVAFFYNGSTSKAIPLPTGATTANVLYQSLNDSGAVVGLSDAGGWIWTSAAGTLLLSDFVPAGWTISDAISISNNGLILAQGSFDGGPSEYLELEPLPEPASYLLAGMGLLIVALRRGIRGIRR
jgi:hypothetical protein